MSQYVLVYKSYEASDWAAQPQEEVQKVIEAWGNWVGSLGDARKGGSAFKFGGKSVSKDATADADNLLTGYAIVEAESFEAACKMAQTSPNVAAGRGTIEVYEALEVKN